MGIPHLITTLEPFAERASLSNHDVVIDGPALAYHVLNICRRNGIGQPSYGLLGRVAVFWLDQLATFSNIKSIYFDGYLPADKLLVRMERMIKNTGQINQFHALHSNSCPTRHISQDEDINIDLFTSSLPDTKQLLPPPFLVPAVIDALKLSKEHRALVQLVPGEADAFCARHLETHGGTVLTSDSDLLIHDLGKGKVMFFRDIYAADNPEVWHCLEFDPQNICERLGIAHKGIRRLGYEVKYSFHATISQIVLNCTKPLVDEQSFEEFSRQYLAFETGTVPTTTTGETVLLKALDPRLSELVLQLGNTPVGTPARMFLPVLMESPLKGSAWEPSTNIRQLAYTLFAWEVPSSQSSVQEYRRVQQQQQKGRDVALLDKKSAEDLLESLLELMAQLKASKNYELNDFWAILCLIVDIRECQAKEKKSHALTMLDEMAKNHSQSYDHKVSWDLIHLAALLQASYYSFRMLQQILAALPQQKLKGMPTSVWHCYSKLRDLPPLTEAISIEGTIDLLVRGRPSGLLGLIKGFIDIEEHPKTPVSSKSSKKRKKGRDRSETAPTRPAKKTGPIGANMFTLLLDE